MATPTVAPIVPVNNQDQELSSIDQNYVSSTVISTTFDITRDIIEAYLYDQQDNFISRITTNYNVTQGVISGSTISQINLDPAKDLHQNNYTQGSYKIDYNFISPIVDNNTAFAVTEISSDRTELRVNNSTYTAQQTEDVVTKVTELLSTGTTFQGYYLDFGNDNILLAVNVAYDTDSILVKLYNPLPLSYSIGNSFTFVRKVSEPVAFTVVYPQEEIITDTRTFLKGPNFNIQLQKQTNNSTQLLDYSTLISTTSSTLYNQLNTVLSERRADLNTDHSQYENFVFFSSAEQRLSNFYFKASQIEDYNTQLTTLSTLAGNPQVSASKAYYENKIQDIIKNFDGYDYYLYYESESAAWPKSSSSRPYPLYSTGSTEVLQWYTAQAITASEYDRENTNYIYNIYPTYLTQDPDNTQFQVFNDMVAQMFDQIWLYTKAIQDRQDGNNSLSKGISIDLVADALESYGVTLYESNFTNSDLYTAYLGLNPAGGTLPPTGSEYINTYVTASGETISFNDAQKLIYKRLYHNLPYLLKKKGTVAGLRVLLNCFGIPDTVIRINEYGGKDKNVNTWDQWYNQFNYQLDTKGTTYLSSSFTLNPSWGASSNRPQAVEFRFKTPGIPTQDYYSQSLWGTDTGTGLILKYTGSAYLSGSYSGSIIDPYNQYATLIYYPTSSNLNNTASIYLPFYDGNWWSVLINNYGNGIFTIYAKNKLYQGADGNTVGFAGSASVNVVGASYGTAIYGTDVYGGGGTSQTGSWNSATKAFLGSSSFSAKIFSGSLQELRYYRSSLSESIFDDYVMNPGSIEGNNTNNAPQELVFRATLGGELYTGSTSVHPKITGSWALTSSFTSTSNFYLHGTPTYTPNYEYYFVDQLLAGIQNPVNKKIVEVNVALPSSGNTNLPSNKVLSAFRSIQQQYPASASFTPDINYVEVAFSPQNEINDDINASIGYFNIGQYIGDPRALTSNLTYYPELQTLSQNHFQKYTNKYNWHDYIRLIKYYDNSVFRMIKDFIPVRAGTATGIVIKQHLLERNRQRQAQVSYTQPQYTASVVSLPRQYRTGSIQVFTGSPAGSVNPWINIPQSWSSSILTKAGIVNQTNSARYEFYNGAFSGSDIHVTDGELQNNPVLQGIGTLTQYPDYNVLLNNVSQSRRSTIYRDVDYSTDILTPVNFSTIISESATYAEVEDSNYSVDSSWVKPRYNGTKNTGNYNLTGSFPPRSITPGYPVDKYSSYFVYFDWIGGSDPQYPGGGNIHALTLIGPDGTGVPLTQDNKNLQFIENLFSTSQIATIWPLATSSASQVTQVEIATGGGLYETIVVVTASAASGFDAPALNGITDTQQTASIYTVFTSGSKSTLTDSGSLAQSALIQNSWISIFTNKSSSFGNVQYFSFENNGAVTQKISFWNKQTGTYVNSYPNTINYTDTYLPLQYGDIIRFGNTGSYSATNTSSLDGTFTGGGLFEIVRIITGSSSRVSSSIEITPLISTSPFTNNVAIKNPLPAFITQSAQNFRVMRRVPYENYIVVKNIPANRGGGFLIPENYNPTYNIYDLARKAGII